MTLNEDQTVTLLNALEVAARRYKDNVETLKDKVPLLVQTFEDQYADTNALLTLLRDAVSIEVTDGP